MNNLLKGRITKHLKSLVRHNGETMTCKDLYQTYINNDAIVSKYNDSRSGKIKYRLMRPDNVFIDIPKIMNYNKN